MKKFLAVMLVLCMLFASMSLSACFLNAGTYKLKSFEAVGLGTFEVGDEYLGQVLDEDTMSIELKADGTCIIKLLSGEIEGEWGKEDGETYINGVKVEFKGKTFVYDAGIMKITFSK